MIKWNQVLGYSPLLFEITKPGINAGPIKTSTLTLASTLYSINRLSDTFFGLFWAAASRGL